MKKIFISMLLLATPMVTFCQVKVNANGRVADTITNSTAILTVGKISMSQYSSYNIGLVASPVHDGSKTNVGVEGAVQATTAHTPQSAISDFLHKKSNRFIQTWSKRERTAICL